MDVEALRRLIDEPERRANVPATLLTEALLQRIADENARINAFYAVLPELALADARRVDEARAQGRRLPLDGLPIAVKDNIDVAGIPTTAASLLPRTVPTEDAPCVARLRRAGAIILGKAALHELAFGATTINPAPYGATLNPWDADRIPGGSSGGAGAALAADLCLAALGSDTGGSIRIPAALNGVSGLRPTYGTVSHVGALHVSWSLDTLGPLARSVAEIARMLSHLTGYDPRDPWAVEYPDAADDPAVDLETGVEGVRIGIPESFFFHDLDDQVERCVRSVAESLASLGALLVPLRLPADERLCDAAATIIRSEALALHRRRYDEDPELFGEEIRRRFELGKRLIGEAVAEAHRLRIEWRHAVKAAFREHVDVILTPTTKTVAPRIDESESIATSWNLTFLTYPWSMAHVPALSIPCGLGDHGLPVGAQLIADHRREALLLRVGAAYQSVTDWHRRRPSIVVPAGV